MALVDPDAFAEKDVAAVYLAGRLEEAQRVEETLTGLGIDYVVDVESYHRNLLGVFPTRYEGVVFYVLIEQAAQAREVLEKAGLVVGLVEEDSP